MTCTSIGRRTRPSCRPTIDCHKTVFGRAPHLLAADAGFWSGKNREHAEEAGVNACVFRRPDGRRRSQRQRQHERWFRRGQRWRTGSEGRVSLLKRRDGLRSMPLSALYWKPTLDRLGRPGAQHPSADQSNRPARARSIAPAPPLSSACTRRRLRLRPILRADFCTGK